jgi:aspartyl-tRNA(Asn)/glutamyl-tRNA(Gln) amidotransferase subunit C
MSLTQDTVNQTAHLARIYLKPEELATISQQLKGILDFIDKLNELDVTAVQPTSHILPVHDIVRTDELRASLPVEQALKNAPHKRDAFFGVPKIIE